MLLLGVVIWLDQLLLLSPIIDRNLPVFLFSFYKALKYVLHLLTGMSQIERLLQCEQLWISKDGLVRPSGKLVKCIERSIELSNSLSSDIDMGSLLQKIIKMKHRGRKNKMLEMSLSRIYELKGFKLEIEEKRAAVFSPMDHIKLLNDFWAGLLDGQPAPQIPSVLWSQLGFQGKDPSTDFRGMGLLGLHQLVSFVKQDHSLATRVYFLSTSEGPLWFPFAVTGINITAFEYLMLKSHSLDIRLYDSVGGIHLGYCGIYSEIFEQFSSAWQNANPRDIMDFPRVFVKVKAGFKRAL